MKPNRECGSLLSVRVIVYAPHPPFLTPPAVQQQHVFTYGSCSHSTPQQAGNCLFAACPCQCYSCCLPPCRCGPGLGYKVGSMPDMNQPVNILEEIVWYKAKEVEVFREKQPLPLLQVRVTGWRQRGEGGDGHRQDSSSVHRRSRKTADALSESCVCRHTG